MSLSALTGTGYAGLAIAQAQIATTNKNVANASDTSYARQSYETGAVTSTQALASGAVSSAADRYLQKAFLQNTSASAYASAIDRYLSLYESAIGGVDSGADISSRLSGLDSALATLAASPSSDTAKADMVDAASALAEQLRSQSAMLRSLQQDVQAEIETAVRSINADLAQIDALNRQIAAASGDVADLENERARVLESLAQKIDVSTYVNADKALVVYSGGALLVGESALTLAVTAEGDITVSGKVATSAFSGGELGGLIETRDVVLTEEQAQLDALANALIEALNTAAGANSADPPATSLLSASGFASSDSLDAAGVLRVALTNTSGEITQVLDFDLSLYSDLGALVSALDATAALSATLGANGALTISAENGANGLVLGESGVSISDTGQSLSSWLGFNRVFEGSSASDIAIAETLANDASALATQLIDFSALAVGQSPIASGDGAGVNALRAALDDERQFAAAGDISAQTGSLLDYGARVVTAASERIAAASESAERAEAVLDQAESAFRNATGVNLDEELAKLTQYQTAYEANAQLLSLSRDLFDILIAMVR
jgi:flagellar hook-associated protein 1